MSDTNLNSINSPSSAPSSAPAKGPDLEGQVREGLALEGAIEVAPTQASGGGDSKPAAQQQTQQKDDGTTPVAAAGSIFGDVKNIPEDTLLRLTRKRIMNRLAALDLQVDKLNRGTSKSRAFDMTQVVSEMRKLHISLQSLYRMAVDRVRDLYTQLR